MAKEVQSKKRKASVPEGEAEKVKKIKNLPAEAVGIPDKKRKATEDTAPVAAKKSKTPKPNPEDTPKAKPAKKDTNSNKTAEKAKSSGGSSKPSKGVESAAKELKSVKPSAPTKTKSKPTDKASLSNDKDEEEEEVENHDDVDDEDDDESEIDDQTEALLKGFESDGDEADAAKEGGLKEGQAVPPIPTMSKKSKKQLQRLGESDTPEKPGVVYVGRIPHGFYEHEMREYFEQFGKILQLRLSRNKRTAASRHMAWIQFESATVASIVAKTMDNYLLFNHLLKVKVVADEQLPADLFKGANKRFKKVPWNKMEGRLLKESASEEVWDKRAEKEQKRREEKAQKLKEIGYDYEYEAPKVKSAKGIAKKGDEQPTLTTNGDGIKAIEAAPANEEPSKPKKEKKAVQETAASTTALATEGSSKPKKDKKSKAVQETAASTEVVTAPTTEEPSKSKKKEKKSEPAETGKAAAISGTEADKKPLKAKASKTDLVGANKKGSEEKAKKVKSSS